MMTSRNDSGQFNTKYELSEFSDLYDAYGEWVTINEAKETTATRLKAGVRAWLHWCENNDVHPFEAVESDVRSYIKSLQLDEAAETTITRKVASVSKYYHFLLTDPDTDADVGVNPTADIQLRKDYNITNSSEYVTVLHQENRDDIIALDCDRITPIFDHVPGKREAIRVRNKLICMMFWQTAVRSDELSRMRVANIDWEHGEIEIRSSKLNRDEHPDLYKRRVWWEENLDYLMRRWEDKRADFDPDGDCPYWFVTENGTQMDSAYMSRLVKRAATNAGVNEPLVRGPDGDVEQWLFTAHRLRHSRITYLANDPVNMDLNALRKMAGHVSSTRPLRMCRLIGILRGVRIVRH